MGKRLWFLIRKTDHMVDLLMAMPLGSRATLGAKLSNGMTITSMGWEGGMFVVSCEYR